MDRPLITLVGIAATQILRQDCETMASRVQFRCQYCEGHANAIQPATLRLKTP